MIKPHLSRLNFKTIIYGNDEGEIDNTEKAPIDWVFDERSMALKDALTMESPDLNDGKVEMSYGVKKEYETQGFMTEAVVVMTHWASK